MQRLPVGCAQIHKRSPDRSLQISPHQTRMLWDWLLGSFKPSKSANASSTLPPLQKPQQQQKLHQQQQQSAGPPPEKEYCLRMAFKLTPTYSSKLQARVRWLKVLRAAQQPAGGSWDPNFSADYITPRRLEQLADVIDSAFLSGSFTHMCAPSYAVSDTRLAPQDAGDCDTLACSQATAGFEPATNAITFYRPSWRTRPSLDCPVQADGVYCTNKLAWLAHTMGHEMVHCIVHHACPEAREMKAYTSHHGHGPIFLQLNKHIFGHDSARYRTGWGRLRPHLQVEPLRVNHSLEQQQQQDEESEQASAVLEQECCGGRAREAAVSAAAVGGTGGVLQLGGAGQPAWYLHEELQQQQQQSLALSAPQLPVLRWPWRRE